jgi:hypothetical protein
MLLQVLSCPPYRFAKIIAAADYPTQACATPSVFIGHPSEKQFRRLPQPIEKGLLPLLFSANRFHAITAQRTQQQKVAASSPKSMNTLLAKKLATMPASVTD